MERRAEFSAVVLAADRTATDPLASAAGVPSKTLVPVAGIPMVVRVVQALLSARDIQNIVLCASAALEMLSPEVNSLLGSGRVRRLDPGRSPSQSAYQALSLLPVDARVLLTTGDHPLLTPRIIDYFTAKAASGAAELAVGLASQQVVSAAYPSTRRTYLRFRDGAYSGCNLFAFMTQRAREAPAFWRTVEQQRKRPWRLVRAFGWSPLLRFALRRLTLEQALREASKRIGAGVGMVLMPFPEAALDVDTIQDWQLADSIAQSMQQGG